MKADVMENSICFFEKFFIIAFKPTGFCADSVNIESFCAEFFVLSM